MERQANPLALILPVLIALAFYGIGVVTTVAALWVLDYPLPWRVEAQPAIAQPQALPTLDLSDLTSGKPTPLSSATPRPTLTPRPTFTPPPTPAATPTPLPTLASPTLDEDHVFGPLVDPIYKEELSLRINVANLRVLTSDGYRTPAPGYVFLILDVTLENLGPGVFKGAGPTCFVVHDARGAMLSNQYIPSALDCKMEFGDLAAGKTLAGCMAYHIPESGALDLIFALRNPQELPEGQYTTLSIR